MAVKSFNPTSPARRQMTVADFSEITAKEPEKNLLASRSNTGGRNSYGRITVRHKGGGNRRKIRHDRLEAQQGRHESQSYRDRVRSEPHRLPGPDPVPRRREGLYPGSRTV